MAATRRGPHVRGDRAHRPRIFVERFEVDGSASPAASRPCAPTSDRLVAGCSSASSRPVDDCRSPPTAPRSACSPTTLRAAGLDRVNISLDTLDRDKFVRMTRRDELPPGARRHRGGQGGRLRTRSRSTPSSSAASTTTRSSTSPRFGREQGVEVRFIEFMPLDAIGHWTNAVGRQPGRDRRRHRRGLPARAAAGPRRGARRPLALPRRRGHGRRDPDASPSRSAATATGCGSPPTASSAPACSRPTNSTCAAACAAARPTTTSRRDRAGRRHQVGRAPDQPGELHPAQPFDEPDRRLTHRRRGLIRRRVAN